MLYNFIYNYFYKGAALVPVAGDHFIIGDDNYYYLSFETKHDCGCGGEKNSLISFGFTRRAQRSSGIMSIANNLFTDNILTTV